MIDERMVKGRDLICCTYKCCAVHTLSGVGQKLVFLVLTIFVLAKEREYECCENLRVPCLQRHRKNYVSLSRNAHEFMR